MIMNGSTGDFESLARQYWDTWNELLGRGAGGGLDAFGLAGAMPPGLGRMDPGAFDWYSRMQQLAMQFSGQQPSAADVTRAWRDMLGGQGANPFAGMQHGLQAGPLFGNDWIEQVRPWLDGVMHQWRQDHTHWLHRPAFGPQREHQERLQRLALAWQDWQERNQAFVAQLAGAGQQAFALFEQRLEQRDAPGQRIESARALFDLWIDAAEEAWAEIALTPEFRHAYAEMTNAQMRLRLGVQREVEQVAALFGLPGRTEIDAVHRKVAELERALHAARRAAQAGVTAPAGRQRTTRTDSAVDAGAAIPPSAAPAKRRAAADRPATPAGKTAKRQQKPVTAKAGKAPASGKKPARSRAVAASASATFAEPAGKKTTPAPRRAGSKPAAAGAPAKHAPAVQPGLGRTGSPASRQAPKATAAGRKASKATPAGKPAAGRKVAAGKATAAGRTATGGTPRNVVSMKDWVSRNLDAVPASPAETSGGTRTRGKRGGPGK